MNEQARPIHIFTPRIPSFLGGQEITRRQRSETIFVDEARDPVTANRTVTATQDDLGPFDDTRYINSSGESEIFFPIFSTPVKCDDLVSDPILNPSPNNATMFKIVLDLNIPGTSPGVGGRWNHVIRVDKFDYVQLFEFQKTFKITDARFLSFNTLTNGVDFTNEQIPNDPTFCDTDLIVSFPTVADFHNKLIVNESSIPKELDASIDPIPVSIIDHGIVIADGQILSCSATEDIDLNMREYWLLEPPTSALLAAMDASTPNDALFDDITTLANMQEAFPGLDAEIFGIIRTSASDLNSFNWTFTGNIFGIADDETIRLAATFGPNLDLSTNTIQFSEGKKLFAGNGGRDLVGF